MTVQEMIEELKLLPLDAEVISPGNHYGYSVSGITEIVQVQDCVLSDGSSYPVVMVVTE